MLYAKRPRNTHVPIANTRKGTNGGGCVLDWIMSDINRYLPNRNLHVSQNSPLVTIRSTHVFNPLLKPNYDQSNPPTKNQIHNQIILKYFLEFYPIIKPLPNRLSNSYIYSTNSIEKIPRHNYDSRLNQCRI